MKIVFFKKNRFISENENTNNIQLHGEQRRLDVKILRYG